MALWFCVCARLYSEEKPDHLAARFLAGRLDVVHHAIRRRQDNVAELAARQQVRGELHNRAALDVEARGDDAGLVDAADEVDGDLAAAVVVDDLELADVALLLHNLQELDDDLARRLHEDLALAGLLAVDDLVEAVAERVDAHHCGGSL